SDTFKFIAGVMLAAGMGIVGVALKGVGSFGEAMAAVAGSEVGVAFLGVAAVATSIAVGSQFLSSRYYHSGNFNALELNAQHTAKYFVKELKKEMAAPVEYPQNRRADNGLWAPIVRPEQQPAASIGRGQP